jgi:hypothetical protein
MATASTADTTFTAKPVLPIVAAMETPPQAASRLFMLAGRAVFTVHNSKGEHYTFRIAHKEATDLFKDTYFVALLTGPNNETDYQYMGMLDPNTGTVRLTHKSRFSPGSKPVAVFNWAVGRIVWPSRWNTLPAGYGIKHEGRCGRCGRTLTTPESIERGIGPECWSKMT